MVGIAKVLEEHLPEGITREDLKIALRSHYKMQNYMRAVLVESHRVNLQGEPVSEIPFEEKKTVKESLEKFYKQQLENYLKRFTPATETPDVASEEPKVKPVEPELKVTPEPVAEKVIVAEPVAVAPIVEEVKPKKLTLKPKPKVETPVESTPVIQAQPVTNNGDCAKSRGLKVTLVLDPASITNIDSTGMKKVPLKVQIGEDGLIATTELSSKSYRKAISSIEEYGVEGCNAILQGAMKQYGVIDDAGLVVQPKKVPSNE
jgi:sRNA-binding protein